MDVASCCRDHLFDTRDIDGQNETANASKARAVITEMAGSSRSMDARGMMGERTALSPALWIAAWDGRAAVVRQLLAEGSDIEERGGVSLSTPLGAASWRGHKIVALLLLEQGAEISATDVYNWTPLHSASRWGREAIVRLLLNRGADLQSKTDKQCTPADIATALSRTQITAMLKAEALRRAQCVAFAMGQQERLGAGSWVQELDAGVVRMVLEEV